MGGARSDSGVGERFGGVDRPVDSVVEGKDYFVEHDMVMLEFVTVGAADREIQMKCWHA